MLTHFLSLILPLSHKHIIEGRKQQTSHYCQVCKWSICRTAQHTEERECCLATRLAWQVPQLEVFRVHLLFSISYGVSYTDTLLWRCDLRIREGVSTDRLWVLDTDIQDFLLSHTPSLDLLSPNHLSLKKRCVSVCECCQ